MMNQINLHNYSKTVWYAWEYNYKTHKFNLFVTKELHIKTEFNGDNLIYFMPGMKYKSKLSNILKEIDIIILIWTGTMQNVLRYLGSDCNRYRVDIIW